ncbi:MAG: hypothetical protein IPJ03_02440 [Ignavibacteriales bacterium]|nr:hypothetical protein [Ignavibacteriales bacterium]
MFEPGFIGLRDKQGYFKFSNPLIGLILQIKVRTIYDIKYRMGKELEENV